MNDNDNKRQTHRGMIVLDQENRFLVSLTGHDKLYSLMKSDKNCISVFEPLSRFEFEASFIEDDYIEITELIRFDNVLKIKHKDAILNMLAILQDEMQNSIVNIKSLNDLQNIYKSEHIPYTVYGFDKVRTKFWQLDLKFKIDELEQSKPGKKREALIANLDKRIFRFEQHSPDQHKRYLRILDSFKQASQPTKDSFDKDNRILLAESEAPKAGEWVEFPFLSKMGKVLVKTVGKSFILSDSLNTVTEATKRRLSGKTVCWVYYEPNVKTQAYKSATAQVESNEKLRPRSINELEIQFNRIKKLFVLDGIKPRNSNSYVGDFRTGVESCDMRPLNKTYWFVVSTENIWYMDGEESTALMHHNIQLGGRTYLGYVLTKADYPDVLNTLQWLNESVIEIRKKINETKF